jgi:DNA replication protein DnaC
MPAMWASAYRVTSKDDLFEAARVAPALVIDDMGSEENAGRAKARLAEIVSERYNQRRLTILTMNDDVLTLAHTYGQRMADRILGAGHTVHCGGESLRLSV